MANEWLASRRWPNLKGAESKEFARNGAACLVKGRTASARMSALVQCIKEVIGEGTASQDLLVVCADPSGASRLRRELRAAALLDADRIPIATCRELACNILQKPQAAEALGLRFSSGRTRILAAYEVDFVMEDVKTLGTRPKRLRELLKFLYRGWTELSDEDPEWLFMAEEIDTFEFLTEELAYLGAVMEPQISNLATKALRLDPELRCSSERRLLFVLDYQNLSRASQLLCQLIAGESLTVVANDEACIEAHESYPYLQGVEEFLHLNPTATIANLEDEPATDAIARSERTWDTPSDEISGMADEITRAVREEGWDPSDIGVVTLHPWWERHMARALEARGIPTNAWYEPLKLRGDIRNLGKCLALRMVTLLRLLADPDDATAWRSWFGFGDYLTRSNQFADMRKTRWATAIPGDVRRDLEVSGYDLGTDLDPLLAHARNLRGSDLLGCLLRTLAGSDAPLPSVLRPLLALGDADAAQMVVELDRRQFFAGLPDRPGVVISSYATVAGLDFAHAYLPGLVNGLFPSAAFFDLTKVSINKQDKMRGQDTRTAHAMSHLGRESLCVSNFRRADRDFAERIGLKQARIFATDDDGTQMGEIEPSIYTDVLLGYA